jgi:hypothetical protein
LLGCIALKRAPRKIIIVDKGKAPFLPELKKIHGQEIEATHNKTDGCDRFAIRQFHQAAVTGITLETTFPPSRDLPDAIGLERFYLDADSYTLVKNETVTFAGPVMVIRLFRAEISEILLHQFTFS